MVNFTLGTRMSECTFNGSIEELAGVRVRVRVRKSPWRTTEQVVVFGG